LPDLGEERLFQSKAKGKPYNNAAADRKLDRHGSSSKPQGASPWYVPIYYPPESAPGLGIWQMIRAPNQRAALDSRIALWFHVEHQRPRASEHDR
jgi:hypothetical protein